MGIKFSLNTGLLPQEAFLPSLPTLMGTARVASVNWPESVSYI